MAFEEIQELVDKEKEADEEAAAKAKGTGNTQTQVQEDPIVEGSVHEVAAALKSAGASETVVTELAQRPDDEISKLQKFKDAANRRVRTYVTLIVEESAEAKMAKKIADTPVGKLRGSTMAMLPLPLPLCAADAVADALPGAVVLAPLLLLFLLQLSLPPLLPTAPWC